MEFLAVVCGLMLLYQPQVFSVIQHDHWFGSWQEKVRSTRLLDGSAGIGMVVTLGLPVLAIYLANRVIGNFAFGLPFFLLNLWVLLYSFGRGDSRAQVDELVNDLERGDLQAAFHGLAVFTVDAGDASDASDAGDAGDARAVDASGFLGELKARLAYSYFERHLSVLFWFLVGGAPLALLYRLSVLSRQNELLANGASAAGRWLWLMEWLPLRVVGLTLALVGHFNRGLCCWRELFWSAQSTQQTLLAWVNGALGDVDDEPGQAITTQAELTGAGIGDQVRQVERLFFNAIVCWLVVIALLVIVS